MWHTSSEKGYSRFVWTLFRWGSFLNIGRCFCKTLWIFVCDWLKVVMKLCLDVGVVVVVFCVFIGSRHCFSVRYCKFCCLDDQGEDGCDSGWYQVVVMLWPPCFHYCTIASRTANSWGATCRGPWATGGWALLYITASNYALVVKSHSSRFETTSNMELSQDAAFNEHVPELTLWSWN